MRDYGNRMGIPTVNGAVIFDERYIGNPLVFCGTVGIMPRGNVKKAARPGDASWPSAAAPAATASTARRSPRSSLHAESDEVSGGAVQIGNAIDEKKMLDVLLQARDRGLFTAITDCGAGGFSSAIGEMGAELGADVHLDRAPLKYEGLSYTEIWISEAAGADGPGRAARNTGANCMRCAARRRRSDRSRRVHGHWQIAAALSRRTASAN